MSIVSNKIDGLPPGSTRPLGQTPNATTSAGNDKPVSAVNESNAISVSGEARQMQAMHSKASQVPEVNQARVDAVKSAISSGQFRVDAQTVAQGLLGMEQALRT